MAPIRRYLRITKYSVLEVRIYLDDPSQAQPWLLNPQDPVLPRVVQAIQPFVLPKLREENERSKGRGKKAKGVKDVVVQDDFEVSIFLTETTSRHAVLTKQKMFKDEHGRIQSNSGKLTGWLHEKTQQEPIDVDEGDPSPAHVEPIRIRDEDDDEAGPSLDDFPVAATNWDGRKRARPAAEEDLFVPEDGGEGEISDDEGFASPSSKRAKTGSAKNHDDKKKLGLKTAYEGFSIYGRILCLIVKRRGNYRSRQPGGNVESGRQMLENFVSTQAQGAEMSMLDE